LKSYSGSFARIGNKVSLARKSAGSTLREISAVVIIEFVSHASGTRQFRSVAIPATISVKRTVLAARGQRVSKRGQVAQVVERSPEKAGVGGSTPSLATIIPKNLAVKSQNFQPTIQPMILTELAL
jgi:hypothetical protein